MSQRTLPFAAEEVARQLGMQDQPRAPEIDASGLARVHCEGQHRRARALIELGGAEIASAHHLATAGLVPRPLQRPRHGSPFATARSKVRPAILRIKGRLADLRRFSTVE